MITDAERQTFFKVLNDINTWKNNGNTELLQTFVDAITRDKSIAGMISKNLGPIKNPQANWDKLMYYPTSFKKSNGKGKLSDEQKKKKVWNNIRLQNFFGDAMTGVGGALNLKNQALSRSLQQKANQSASDRQRELYGATPEDRAAASASPMLSALGNIEQLIFSLIANRAYQGAAEKRSAYLQAIMDAYNNNVGMSGTYADARRHMIDLPANSAPQGGM